MTALFGKKKDKDTTANTEASVEATPVAEEKKKPTKKTPAPKTSTKATKKSKTSYQEDVSFVLMKPRITEKAALASDQNVYTFVVHADANKTQIKKAVEQAYKVTPVRVNIINTKKKEVRRRNGIGYKKGFKKAMVFLKKGDSIELI